MNGDGGGETEHKRLEAGSVSNVSGDGDAELGRENGGGLGPRWGSVDGGGETEHGARAGVYATGSGRRVECGQGRRWK